MSFKKLTYSQKNKYLLAATPLILILLYVAAIGRTVQLYTSNRQLEEKINQARAVKPLEKELRILNASLHAYRSDTLKDHSYLMELVSNFCQQKHLTLQSFPAPTFSQEENVRVETYVITTAGDFRSMLELTYELEQVQAAGRISSVDFRSAMDSKRKKPVLTCTIHLQKIQFQ
jgi:hypothetical protein